MLKDNKNCRKIRVLQGHIDAQEFHHQHLALNLPLLVKGYANQWRATQCWGTEYFRQKMGQSQVVTKEFKPGGEIVMGKMPLNEYMDSVDDFEYRTANGDSRRIRPAYWHDVPIFELFPELIADAEPFQADLLPRFYQRDWHRYVQFFMSSAESVTKLHFDTLRTHNVFFQIKGTKEWVLYPPEDMYRCGRNSWRWFDIDPDNPDVDSYPEYALAQPIRVRVEPGDMLYIPPGTLHHVKSLDTCISFNIDFHTPESVMDSFRYIRKGMPKKVVYYNLVSALGVIAGLPSRWVFPFYKSYLNFVS
ncbi:cupin-like domain-containing protein [Paraneptunicella aestuarii]|uniref:cupin-like domain-containing protein n=1 Tax=Paraneptunicella aestuarii TaxID=2831148 RepID=UPI001E45EA76|nr:cupin-like domain-containing protein [Paraneptunicella aestuarii]UAA39977.1 cupin-like domain-containing protein [Paraneptunicella aestuarii]